MRKSVWDNLVFTAIILNVMVLKQSFLMLVIRRYQWRRGVPV